MKRTLTSLVCLLIILLSIASCKKSYVDIQSVGKMETTIKKIQEKYIADKREAIYEIECEQKDGVILLSGQTSVKDAYSELNALADTYIKNEVRLLPSNELGNNIYGLINVSVSDVRTQNKFTSGMATQTLLGTPVKVWDKQGEWYRVQLPDTYHGWVHRKQIVLLDKNDYNKWINSVKIIFTQHYGFAYSTTNKQSQTVSDVVYGDLLKLEDELGAFYKVSYPDGRIAYVDKSEAMKFNDWLGAEKLSNESLIQKAYTMLGLPYVWGGTSTKGLDCSGMVKTVFFMHGIIILRDASQQVHLGTPIDAGKDFENLQRGDLMFFGTKDENGKEKIRHVGFYLGNKEFIHASGSTHISSLDSTKPNYDEENDREFLRASRITNENVGTKGIWKIEDTPFCKAQE